MVSIGKVFGGAAYLGTQTAKTLPIYSARYIVGAPTAGAIYTLPRIGPLPRCGPHWVVVNQGSANITIRRSDGVDLGVVLPNDRVRIFLITIDTAQSGVGSWRLAGSGNTFVGEQNPIEEVGFNFGTGSFPEGAETDLGDATPNAPEHGLDLDFGHTVLDDPPILLP